MQIFKACEGSLLYVSFGLACVRHDVTQPVRFAVMMSNVYLGIAYFSKSKLPKRRSWLPAHVSKRSLVVNIHLANPESLHNDNASRRRSHTSERDRTVSLCHQVACLRSSRCSKWLSHNPSVSLSRFDLFCSIFKMISFCNLLHGAESMREPQEARRTQCNAIYWFYPIYLCNACMQ